MTEVDHQTGWSGKARLPVSVMVGHLANDDGGRAWRVMGVVVGQRFASDGIRSMRMRSGPEGDLFLWSGFTLCLVPRKVESYAYNINSDTPCVYVVARQEEDGLRPLQVTVSLDDAQNLDATDLRDVNEQVFKVAIPPEVYRWVERFVLDHYVPRKRKARGKKRSKALFDAEVGDSLEDGEA